jgi:hypothetical protein
LVKAFDDANYQCGQNHRPSRNGGGDKRIDAGGRMAGSVRRV